MCKNAEKNWTFSFCCLPRLAWEVFFQELTLVTACVGDTFKGGKTLDCEAGFCYLWEALALAFSEVGPKSVLGMK